MPDSHATINSWIVGKPEMTKTLFSGLPSDPGTIDVPWCAEKLLRKDCLVDIRNLALAGARAVSQHPVELRSTGQPVAAVPT